jgi:DNA-binding IclR family transcriptional regulator
MAEPAKAAQPSVKSAERALRLLELLAKRRQLTFAELQRELGLPKSSLHALLTTMSELGWAAADRRGALTLGYRALALGIAGQADVAFAALTDDLMEQLGRQVDETVHLARLDGSDILYLASKYSRHALQAHFQLGRRLPAHVTALGKAMLALLPPDELSAHLPDPLVAITPRSIATLPALQAELRQARQRGYALDDEEGTVGLRCFAVAIRHRDLPLIAVSCSVPTARIEPAKEDSIVAALLELKAALLARLDPGGQEDFAAPSP